MIHAQLFGDFTCPLTAVSIRHLLTIQQRIALHVEWIGVEQYPSLPPGGKPLEGEERLRLQALLDHVSALTGVIIGTAQTRLPRTCLPHLVMLAARRAACPVLPLVREIMSAYWERGCDISDAAVISEALSSLVDRPALSEVVRQAEAAYQALAASETNSSISKPVETDDASNPTQPASIRAPELPLLAGQHLKNRELARASKIRVFPTLVLADYTVVGPQPIEVLESVCSHYLARFGNESNDS